MPPSTQNPPAVVVAAPAYDDDRRHDDGDDGDAAGSGARLGRRSLRLLRRSVGLVAVIAFWQWVSTRNWWHGNIPSPHEVWDALVQLEQAGQLWPNITASLGRVARGLLIGGTLGLAAGILSGLFRLGEDLIDAPFQALRMLPSLAPAPLFIIWFGIGDTAKVNLIAVGVFAPMYLNTYHGIRADRRPARRGGDLVRPAPTGADRPRDHPRRPAADPRRCAPGARRGVVHPGRRRADPQRPGLGSLMTDAQQYFRTDVMFVVLAIYAALGLFTDVFVRLLERKALAWRRSFVGS